MSVYFVQNFFFSIFCTRFLTIDTVYSRGNSFSELALNVCVRSVRICVDCFWLLSACRLHAASPSFPLLSFFLIINVLKIATILFKWLTNSKGWIYKQCCFLDFSYILLFFEKKLLFCVLPTQFNKTILQQISSMSTGKRSPYTFLY